MTSGLTYLVCFTWVTLASKSICKMFLSGIYRGETSEMSQALNHVFLNLRYNLFQDKERLVRMVDQNGGKYERFQKYICIKMHLIQIDFVLFCFVLFFFRRSSPGDI